MSKRNKKNTTEQEFTEVKLEESATEQNESEMTQKDSDNELNEHEEEPTEAANDQNEQEERVEDTNEQTEQNTSEQLESNSAVEDSTPAPETEQLPQIDPEEKEPEEAPEVDQPPQVDPEVDELNITVKKRRSKKSIAIDKQNNQLNEDNQKRSDEFHPPMSVSIEKPILNNPTITFVYIQNYNVFYYR